MEAFFCKMQLLGARLPICALKEENQVPRGSIMLKAHEM